MKLVGRERSVLLRARTRQTGDRSVSRLTNAGVDSVTVGSRTTAEVDEAIENLNLALA